MQRKEKIIHPFEPIYDAESKILILGTMPSPISREQNFYYGHPQNRFWKILADLFGEPPLANIPEKEAFLHRHHIALWDVFSACEISGADDSSIRNAEPNDLGKVLSAAPIRAVFTNGQKASAGYKKFFDGKYDVFQAALPSTSPANCRNHTYETLRDAYRIILQYIDE